jgi:hypothetical protein
MSNKLIFEDKNYKRLNRATISKFEAMAITIPLDFLLRTIQNISNLSSKLETDLSDIDFITLIGYVYDSKYKSNTRITQDTFASGLDVENQMEQAFNITSNLFDLSQSDVEFLEQFKTQKPLTLVFGDKYVSLSLENKARALISPILTYLYLQYYYLSMGSADRNVLDITREWYDDYNDHEVTGWGFRYDFKETFGKMIENDIETLEYFYDIMVEGRIDDLVDGVNDYGYVLQRISFVVRNIVSNPSYNDFMRLNVGYLNLRYL